MEGGWNDKLDQWLDADLGATDKPLTFVFGHFPAFPQPDRDSGHEGHLYDTDFSAADGGARRDALWHLLKKHRVTAYVCGHTHSHSLARIDGIWQVDAGHARGPRDPNWHGPSTFLRFVIGDDRSVVLETWRQPFSVGAGNEEPYSVWHTDTLAESLMTDDAPPPAVRITGAAPNPFNPGLTVTLVR